ncbi:proline iminopeptidase [Rhizobiales bacterium GAS188]|nr:proline iminopeptidase [Rhizobiales bacterium GAS188]
MFVDVNGVKLYFDVEGAGLVTDGPRMRSKPTLILLHGGPGFDHTGFKPAFSALADIVQIIYFDHRGNGRSADGNPESWNLAQWGDDVKGLCDALGIERPIVYGVSFGGFVAQAYAARHPDHPAKLILVSTAAQVDFPIIFAAFERLGGHDAREVAEAYWLNPTPEGRAKYMEVCLPFYRQRPAKPNALTRAIIKNDVAIRFNGPNNEHGRMDFRSDLARIRCPVLVLAGDQDPITPMPFSETIIEYLPSQLVRFERFAGCGHNVPGDAPERAFALIRDFIGAPASSRQRQDDAVPAI